MLPNQRRRHERLSAALELAAENTPPVVTGDATDVLPDRLADVPADATLCVFSTITLYQFSDEAIGEIREALAEQARIRTGHWLSGDPDYDGEYPGYRHLRFEGGTAVEERVATFESYGAWVRWLADQ